MLPRNIFDCLPQRGSPGPDLLVIRRLCEEPSTHSRIRVAKTYTKKLVKEKGGKKLIPSRTKLSKVYRRECSRAWSNDCSVKCDCARRHVMRAGRIIMFELTKKSAKYNANNSNKLEAPSIKKKKKRLSYVFSIKNKKKKRNNYKFNLQFCRQKIIHIIVFS